MDILRLLQNETGLSEDDLNRIVRTAPRRYKVFEIPKRSGGMREIAQPARELKFIQRVLIRTILTELPVHAAAQAYLPGKSIRDNAAAHAGAGPILKMDFVDFFPSIRATDWIAFCKTHGTLDQENAVISARLMFRKKKGERLHKLSIGAPSSPILSNILLYQFDDLLTKEALKRGITYTRYADDMTFSGQRIGMLKDMVKVVPTVARSVSRPRLKVNEAKTTFVTASNRRIVTGVTLSNNGAIGIGHERKRLISAKVHRAFLNRLSIAELAELAGELSFVNVVEPQFIQKLCGKYSLEVIVKIRQSVSIP